MSDIKNRIKKITPYFKEMQVVNDEDGSIIYVSVSFPNTWIIDDEIEKKFNVTVTRDEYGSFLFCADIDEGFDTVFDAIDYNIDKMRTALERARLLREKVEELRSMFEDESISLESLKTLEFTYKGKRKKATSSVLDKKTADELIEEVKAESEASDE